MRGEDLLPFAESYIRADKPGAALALVNDDLDRLSQIARRFDQHGYAQFADAARTKALALLASQRKTEPDADTLRVMQDLANAFRTGRNYAKAEPLLSDLLARARESPSTNSSQLESRLWEMADLRYRQKRYADAEALYRERIERRLLRPGGETSDTVLGVRASLGRLYSDWAWAERATAGAAARERAIEGEKLLREIIAVREPDARYATWRKAELENRLGGALSVVAFTDRGLIATTREPKLVEAEAALQRGQAGMEQDKTTETKYKRDGIERFIRLYEAWPKPDQLAEWKQKLAAFEEAQKRKPAQP